MIGEFYGKNPGRPAAVVQLSRGTVDDFCAFLADCGIDSPPQPLGKSLYLVHLPDEVEVNPFLSRLAGQIEDPPPELALELVETRMAVAGAGKRVACGEFLLIAPGTEGPGPGRIILSPGIGFGSGSHPSTRLAVALLSRYLNEFIPKSVLDAGCGSGLLAMVAARLGARRVLAVEVDARAAAEAKENVAINALSGTIEVKNCPMEEIEADADLLVANMTPAVLCSLAPRLMAMAGEGLIVSGLQGRQADEFSAIFAAGGFVEEERLAEEGWQALTLRRQVS